MKKNLTACLSLILLLSFTSSIFAQQTAQKARGIGYLEYLPPGYHNTNEKFPVLFFLHGIGEKGDGSSQSLFSKVARNGPPKHIKNGNKMCFNVNGKEECFIVISPQLSGKGNWSADYIEKIVDYVVNSGKYKVDKSRIYLTGLSLGGGGTWTYAFSNEKNANRLAAIAPIASWGSPNKGCTVAERNMAVWAFHGDKDNRVAYKKGLDMFNAVKRCNDPKSKADLKFTTYKGVSHNSWVKAYSTDHSVQNQNLYEWLLKQSLNKKKDDDDDDDDDDRQENRAPVADAGKDQIETLPINNIILHGSGEKGSSDIVKFSWEKISGPSVTMKNQGSNDLKLENLKEGVYKFRLTVTDKKSLSDIDDVVITVKKTNVPPVANAGNDKSIKLPANSLILNGSGTGNIKKFEWRKISGPSVTLINQNTKNLKLEKLVEGTYKFRLTVSDDNSLSGTDEITVKVNRADVPPVADAGNDKTVTLPANSVILNGRANGTIKKFAWNKLSGPSVVLRNQDTKDLKLEKLVEGSYKFRLTVTDDNSLSDTDEVSLVVQKEAATEKTSGNEGSWLEVTAKAAAGKDLVLFYNSRKSTGERLPVAASGNDKLTFKLKTISGNPNWAHMEAQVTASYQREAVVIQKYITKIDKDWTTVTIPLSDFHFESKRLKAGVSDFRLKMRYGFGVAVFGLDEIQFTGGTKDFVWYGDSYTTSGSSAAVTESPEFYISSRKSSETTPPPPPPTPEAEEEKNNNSWLEVTAKAAAGKELVLFYNSRKSTGQQLPVTTSGNNKLTFKLKTISGNPNWSHMEAQVTASYQREAVVIKNYITKIDANWTTITIPLSDFHFEAKRLKAGVSDFRLKMRNGFGASVFGLDEIKFTGGTKDFVWYGDSYTASGSYDNVVECPEFYISARKGAEEVVEEKATDSWLEVTAKAAAGKELVLFYNSRKSAGERLPVTASGNDKLTFKLKTISGNPNWSHMEAQVTASYQREAVVIKNYITKIDANWTTITIPLSDFHFEEKRLKAGVSDFRLKMRNGFGASVFGLDEIKFTGGTNDFVWYGDTYTASGSKENVFECPEFFISNRISQKEYSAGKQGAGIENQVTQKRETVEKSVEVYDWSGQKIDNYVTSGNTKEEIMKELQLKSGTYIIRVQTNVPNLRSFKALVR